MNREIKFKGWDGKRMYEWKESGLIENSGIYEFNSYETVDREDGGRTIMCYVKHWDDESIIKLQFIGLNDKNGKEIYEGDILSIKLSDCNEEPQEILSYVIYDEKDLCYTSIVCNDNPIIKPGGKVNIYPESVIIGNIYENSEHLKLVSNGE